MTLHELVARRLHEKHAKFGQRLMTVAPAIVEDVTRLALVEVEAIWNALPDGLLTDALFEELAVCECGAILPAEKMTHGEDCTLCPTCAAKWSEERRALGTTGGEGGNG